MNRYARLWIIAVFFAGVASLFLFRPKHPPVVLAASTPAIEPKSQIHFPETATSLPARPTERNASATLSLDQLVTRFNLGAVEKLKLNNALSVVWHELTEARGANAQVEYYDGTRLVTYVPGLVLSDDALIQVVVGRFNESLGEQKTLAILSDPQGKAAVDELLSIELLRRGSRYRFERISAKNDSGKNLPLENALFNLTWKYDTPSGNLAREIAESGWSNWSIPETYNIQLGWNAMSKAPQGYFRAEPIAGAQSKPAPSPTLIRDLDTGTIQILNDKYPGSVEIIDAPKG